MNARELLEWNDQLPEAITVVQHAGPGIDDKATATYMVVADYGWAERILSSGSYEGDAQGIAAAIREVCGIQAKVPA